VSVVELDLVAQDEVGAGVAGFVVLSCSQSAARAAVRRGAESCSSRTWRTPSAGWMSPAAVRASRIRAWASSWARA
jgi:hypothetical protein